VLTVRSGGLAKRLGQQVLLPKQLEELVPPVSEFAKALVVHPVQLARADARMGLPFGAHDLEDLLGPPATLLAALSVLVEGLARNPARLADGLDRMSGTGPRDGQVDSFFGDSLFGDSLFGDSLFGDSLLGDSLLEKSSALGAPLEGLFDASVPKFF